MMNSTSKIATPTRNKFESFDEFQSFVREAFIKGSAIDSELFDACVEFHQDVEFDYGHEVSTPIHEALGWDFKRFGHYANENLYAAFLKNEDGSIWQAVVSLWDEEKQRPYRYLAPKGNGDRVFLPPVPPFVRKRIGDRYGVEIPDHGSFWEWLENIDIPRIPTEGGKKGLCILSLGYVPLTLYGCFCGAKAKDELGNEVNPYLTTDLERFASPDSKWLFAFDRDEKQKAKLDVAHGKKKLRLALSAAGGFTEDIIWKSEHGKGADDLVVNGGSGAFDAAYHSAIAKLERALQTESAPNPKQAKSRNKQHMNLLSARWGKKLRFNEMTLKPELDGKPIHLDTLFIRIADEFDIDIGSRTACQTIMHLALEQPYHPVREYLESVAALYPEETLDSLMLNSMAYRYLGSAEPLHNVFMRKHMIGQVRRIFDPGSQHDTAVVLQGKQGIQKSKFWQTLAVNPDWFDDTVTSGNNDKDDRMKLRRFWFLELAEIDSVFKRKEVASLRAFFTTKADNLRVPYGSSIEQFPRTSCFVGSVNPEQFLCDPEGHRRYWVIPTDIDRIPVEILRQERDRLWAAAVHAYRRGEMNWLTPLEEKRNALLNKRYEIEEDSWVEVIAHYLETKDETTVGTILGDCLKIELGKHDRSSQMRVAEVLKKLGWGKSGEKKRLGSSNPTPTWKKVSTECVQGLTKVSTLVSQPSSLDISSISDTFVDTFDSSKDFSQEVDISRSNTTLNQSTEKSVYTKGVTKDKTTKNQSSEECDTLSSHNLAVGDEVEVDELQALNHPDLPKVKGKRLIVSTIDKEGIWVRKQKKEPGNPPYLFQAHQLKKC